MRRSTSCAFWSASPSEDCVGHQANRRKSGYFCFIKVLDIAIADGLGGMRALPSSLTSPSICLSPRHEPPAAAAASGGDVSRHEADARCRLSESCSSRLHARVFSRGGPEAQVIPSSPAAAPTRSEATRRGSMTPLLHAVHKAQPRAIAAARRRRQSTRSSRDDAPLCWPPATATRIRRDHSSAQSQPALAANDSITALDLARSGVPDMTVSPSSCRKTR